MYSFVTPRLVVMLTLKLGTSTIRIKPKHITICQSHGFHYQTPLQPVMETGGRCFAGGRICGQIVRGLVRWAVGDQVKVSLTSYAVIGAAAYMGGSTRMTLTSVVMVMETTGALQLIVPIMLTVFFAKARHRPPSPTAHRANHAHRFLCQGKEQATLPDPSPPYRPFVATCWACSPDPSPPS